MIERPAPPPTAVPMAAHEVGATVLRRAGIEAVAWLRRAGAQRTPRRSVAEYDGRWAAQIRQRRWADATCLEDGVRRSSYGDRVLNALVDFRAVRIPAPDYFLWRARKLAEILRAAGVADDDPVIELGCGVGKNLAALAHSGFCRLAGTDVSQQAIDGTREHLGHLGVPAELRCADLLDLVPHRDLVADRVVLTNYVLEQLPGDLEVVLRSLAAARPRQVVHVEPCPDLLPGRRRWEQVPSTWHARAHNYQVDLMPTLTRLADQEVLRVLEVRALGFSPYLFHSPTLLRWAPA